MPPFRYRLFGLNIASDIELPDLLPATGEAVDVAVRSVSPQPKRSADIAIDGVATYCVPDGRTIEISKASDADWADVRLFLLGSAMGMLLYRRGDLPLHANAVDMGGESWAFLGASGAGKSTLAEWLQRQGHRLLADDICVTRQTLAGEVMVYAGIPRMRLWEDAAIRAGLDPASLPRSVPGAPEYRKYDVAVAPSSGLDAVRLAALCVLDSGGEWAVEPLQGLEAVESLYAHSYRGAHVGPVGNAERHWRSCLALAADVPMFCYRRTMDPDRMDDENRRAVAAISAFIAARQP